ncbi:MAG: YitT family protein [Schaedlerella sp.]|nr:YitT family protein [Schaedlerella sp.]
MKKGFLTELKNLLIITAASFVYAVGISMFLDPNQLAPGGVTGIAVILNRLVKIETGTLYFLLNVPIVLIGIWKFGLRFISKTAYAITIISVFTNMLSSVGSLTDDLLINAAVGGILIAVGIGLIFKAGATTGGTDIIIKILRQKYRHLKTGFLFLCSDVIIVAISGLVFQNWTVAFYALATVVVSGKALDYVLYGGDEAKMMFIMTDKSHEIGKRLMEELDVGVTYLNGEGGWTGKNKRVVFSMVPKRRGPEVEEIVKSEDPAAFMVVTSASEIYGEGYKNLFEEVI